MSILTAEGAIEIVLSPTFKLVIARKFWNGELFIDVRKWVKYPNMHEFIPSQKGLMLKPEDWKASIQKITELLQTPTPTPDD